MKNAEKAPTTPGTKKSARGSVAPLLADLARQEHPNPKPGGQPRSRRVTEPLQAPALAPSGMARVKCAPASPGASQEVVRGLLPDVPLPFGIKGGEGAELGPGPITGGTISPGLKV